MPGSPAARGCEGDSLPGERKSGELRRGARADAGDRSGEERAGEGHADRLDWAALGFRLERRLWRGAAGEERVAASGTARNGRRQTERSPRKRRRRAEGQVVVVAVYREPGRWPTGRLWMDKFS